MNTRERKAIKEQQASHARSLLAQHNLKSKEVVQSTPLAHFLGSYSDYFINDCYRYEIKTKSDDDEKRFLELVRHTFVKYRTPSFLADVWVNKLRNKAHINYKPRFGGPVANKYIVDADLPLWHICVAQGGSLYKEHAKEYLTKKEVHAFLTCSHPLDFNQALIYAVASTFAESEGMALRLARSKLSTIKLTEYIKAAIYFFCKNMPSSIEEVNDLTDFIIAKQAQERLPNGTLGPMFTLSGLTLDSLRKKTKDWHYALARVKAIGTASWEGAPLPDEAFESKSQHGTDIKWFFTQIKNTKALAAEGNAMHHCVYGYKDRCAKSSVYIWSLAKEEQGSFVKKVTIELNNNGDIVQARGFGNRVMKAEERNIVRIWAKKNSLSLVC